MMTQLKHNQFWAKTTISGEPGLSVLDHCVNVGCVGLLLKNEMEAGLKRLCPQKMISLIAMHDIGKISTGFAVKSPIWITKHGLIERSAQFGWDKSESNHAAVSQDFVWEKLPSGKAKLWKVAVGGHHGRFLGKRYPAAKRELDREMTSMAREALFKDLVTLFGPLPHEPPESDSLLLFVSGWMTVADWIGSNEVFFPLLTKYDFETSLRRARLALEAVRWNRGRLKNDCTFSQLFKDGTANAFVPNSLQQKVLQQIKSPGLHIIEAPMGCGKTEAALFAAYQLISKGHHHGIYFALPTQLTSNRIHERVETFLSRALDEETDHPLAHSNSWLHHDLQIHIRPVHENRIGDDSALDHAREARSWFTSSKQALLARYGVGTIDQALLGAVAAKYCAVRLFGLAGKVVILDEVHSYDAYMSRLIDTLIGRLLSLNCTVIILSATLTQARRNELLQAAKATDSSYETAYPLISSVDSNKALLVGEPEISDTSTPAVNVTFSEPNDFSVMEKILESAGHGACVLCIRNTVDSAQDTFRMLQSMNHEGGPEIGLLHSRFPQFAREANENRWMSHLGKDAFDRPDGCVLVATQVVEQSVDIDADLLVSDLAPTDMLLQRMGRLWRHPRTERPLDCPKFLILCESFEGLIHWKQLKQALGKSGFVYPPYVLLRSAEVWKQRKAVSLPMDIRNLLESTYALRSMDDEPKGWAHWRDTLEKRTQQMVNTALTRTHILGNVPLKDEEGMQTRWNDFPSADLLLLSGEPQVLKAGETALRFINGDSFSASDYEWRFPVAAAVHRNMVRIPRYSVRSGLDAGITPDWLRLHTHSTTVFGIVDPDSGQVHVPGNDESISLSYHSESGLRIYREKTDSTPQTFFEEDDESWF